MHNRHPGIRQPTEALRGAKRLWLATALPALLAAWAPTQAADCAWRDDFVSKGLDGMAYALTVFDDGTGAALYVAGDFHNAAGVPHRRIARWDGDTWSALGEGLPDKALALLVFNDALYAAGRLYDPDTATIGGYVWRWSGTQWVPLGQGFDGQVNALAIYDDGTGPALYAGGEFTWADGATARRLARWNGTHWQEYGGGITCNPISGRCTVNALRAMPFYGSNRLFVGGRFTHADGLAMNNAQGNPASPYINWGNIGSWNGSRWYKLAGGLDQQVRAIAEFDDIPDVSSLRVGGDFDYGLSSGVYLGLVAYYGFSQFSRLNNGFYGSGVHALEVIDPGDGPALYAAGNLDDAPSTDPGIPDVPLRNVARWNGVYWESPGLGLFGETYALAQFDDGSGPALYAAGAFFVAGEVEASRIAKWQCITALLFSDGFE